TKKLMYRDPAAWDVLMEKLVEVLAAYGIEQVKAGADSFQVFDSWVGCLSPDDYRRFALPHTTTLIERLKGAGVPVIYFGTDSATLLTSMTETGADVIGLDWRIHLSDGWEIVGDDHAVQGNLDPVVLFAGEDYVRRAARDVLDEAAGRPGHIFNLGHGILQHTPVDNVIALVNEVHEYSSKLQGVAR
ncbi:MAG TPA: uroporphyrinogen decarboxylase family protein, partial [Terriglobales bacterium]